MDVNDPFKGPLDVLPWGSPVQGDLSSDRRWMVDPKPIAEQAAEQRVPLEFDISSPERSHHQCGETLLSGAKTEDIDLELLSALGEAVTRGSDDIRASVARPVPPSTVGSASPAPSSSTVSKNSPLPIQQNDVNSRISNHGDVSTPLQYVETSSAPPSSGIMTTGIPSLLRRSAEFGEEAAVTAITTTAGALGGAALGEIVGGDFAVSHVGSIAEPIG